MQAKHLSSANLHILYNPKLVNPPLEPLFDRNRHAQHSSQNTLGRGCALVFQDRGLELVLKQYRRGGLFRRLVRDSYAYTGLERTRMWREFKLLAAMRELDLPVPQPVAARCQRISALSYRGDLITQCIPKAQTLAEYISKAPLDKPAWLAIGCTLARFHKHNVYHADLNANNIMLDEQLRVYLIDFDKGEIREEQKKEWTQSNVQRLLRSLNKLKSNSPEFHFSPGDWEKLREGYFEAAPDRN